MRDPLDDQESDTDESIGVEDEIELKQGRFSKITLIKRGWHHQISRQVAEHAL